MRENSQHTVARSEQRLHVRLDRVSWDDLRFFATVGDHSSFRKAAKTLKISASTLTRRMERLEYHLQTKLFERLPDGVKLTVDGERLFVVSNQMRDASQSLTQEFCPPHEATLKIGMRGFGIHWMLRHLDTFQKQHPTLSLDIHSVGVNQAVSADTDLVIDAGPCDGYRSSKIAHLRLVPFVSRSYADNFGLPTPSSLSSHRMIQCGSAAPAGTATIASGRRSVPIRLHTDDLSTHLMAIRLGFGIGLLPSYLRGLLDDLCECDLGCHAVADIWINVAHTLRPELRASPFIDWLKDIFHPSYFEKNGLSSGVLAAVPSSTLSYRADH